MPLLSCAEWRGQLLRKSKFASRAAQLAGLPLGRLVPLAPVWRNERREIIWVCRCQCGALCKVLSNRLSAGRTRSCGCLKREASLRNISAYNQRGKACH
jgi:hypothetical protein